LSINPAQDILRPAALQDLTQGADLLAQVEDLIHKEEFPHRKAFPGGDILRPAVPQGLIREVALHTLAANPILEEELPHCGVHLHEAAGAYQAPGQVAPRPRALEKNKQSFSSVILFKINGLIFMLRYVLCRKLNLVLVFADFNLCEPQSKIGWF
jgi:hypothetical protein